MAADDTLYRCLDKVLPYREELFGHLQGRWKDLFGARFEVLLYDLTSTYFESDPPFADGTQPNSGRFTSNWWKYLIQKQTHPTKKYAHVVATF